MAGKRQMPAAKKGKLPNMVRHFQSGPNELCLQKWDCAVEANAQKWADQSTFAHSKVSSRLLLESEISLAGFGSAKTRRERL